MTTKNIFSWLLRLLAALIMLQTLYFKFSGSPESVYIFSAVGIEPWGRIATGVAELVAAILLLIPATVAIGALMGTGIMTGAIITHLFIIGIEVQDDAGQLFLYALIVFIACLILVIQNRKQLAIWRAVLFGQKKRNPMRASIFLTAFTIMFLQNNLATAQGCSDAGFCTIGNLGQQSAASHEKQKLTILLPVGLGDEDVLVFNPAIQYDHQLNNSWAVQAKITANYANGNLGSATGPGDVFLSGTYFFPSKKDKWKISTTLGTKLPLNQSDLKEGGLPLPMQYQSSIGTIDLIAGIAFTHKRWQLAAGWQQPLSGTNGNQFLPVYWPGNTDAAKYIPSNDFNRRADLLFRSLYKYKPSERFSFNGGLLGIFHVGKDTYIDANLSNKPIAINGSAGLTLNATLAGWYNVSKKLQLGLQAGVPVVVRDKRPDGLTRSFVVSPELSWNF